MSEASDGVAEVVHGDALTLDYDQLFKSADVQPAGTLCMTTFATKNGG